MRIIIISTIILLQLLAIGYLSITTLGKHGAAAVFYPSILEKDSLIFDESGELKYFFEPKPNSFILVRPEWLDVTYKYEMNADALHERYDYKIQKQKDTYRIVALGDSFTFGWAVPTDKNWTEVLEDLLNSELRCSNYKKFEIINLGVPSYDIQYAAHRFNLRGAKYNPDLVLWFYINNDFDEINEWLFPKWGFSNPYQKNRNQLFIKFMEEIVEEFGTEEIIAYQKKALASITSTFSKSLVLFSVPPFTQPRKIDNIQIIEKFIESRPETFLYTMQSDLTELEAVLPDHHPSIKGHRIIAEDLLAYLTDNNFIPCN